MKKFIIWSNLNLNIEDWKKSYEEFLEINEINGDPENEREIYQYMEQMNEEYLDDERINLNIQKSQPIICIADIGRWNGRIKGYKDILSGNISDCLYSNADFVEWYVDGYGNLRATEYHHDGKNYLLYRVFKNDVSEEQMENFRDKLFRGKATKKDISRLTRKIGKEIAKVYGW